MSKKFRESVRASCRKTNPACHVRACFCHLGVPENDRSQQYELESKVSQGTGQSRVTINRPSTSRSASSTEDQFTSDIKKNQVFWISGLEKYPRIPPYYFIYTYFWGVGWVTLVIYSNMSVLTLRLWKIFVFVCISFKKKGHLHSRCCKEDHLHLTNFLNNILDVEYALWSSLAWALALKKRCIQLHLL